MREFLLPKFDSEMNQQIVEAKAFFPGSYLVWIVVFWPCIFCPISFLLYFCFNSHHYYTEDGIHQIPTISLSGVKPPAGVVLTYGLHSEAFLLMIFFVLLYILYYHKITRASELVHELPNRESSNQNILLAIFQFLSCSFCFCSIDSYSKANLHKWNFVTLIFGLFAAFCMSIVGSVTLELNSGMHGTFAFFMFLFGILHSFFFYYHISRILPTSKKALFIHQISLFFSIPFNIFVFIMAGIIYISCDSRTCRRFYVDVSPTLEFSTVLSILLYVSRFAEEFVEIDLASIYTPSILINHINNPEIDPFPPDNSY